MRRASLWWLARQIAENVQVPIKKESRRQVQSAHPLETCFVEAQNKKRRDVCEAELASDRSTFMEARGGQLADTSEKGMRGQKYMICHREQTSLILREDKLWKRELRVDELKHLTADLIH